ncbi:DNA replication complex GINS protein Sld5 [Lycorma delicatula]|uniref:DNA replication complex GINS protein Sld5 n=1 Tax=Lycorma delicatula TaxID=130591 RepID=UPI003F518249
MADFADTEECDDQILTPNELIGLFMEGWQNERLSPELLPHLGYYVDCMMEQVSQMEENIQHLDKKDLRRSIHKFELQRMQYLINNYLRTRLDKIEMNALSIIQDENTRDDDERYLYPSERKFAAEYLMHSNKLFTALLGNMPVSARPLTTNQAMIKPDLETHVFIRVKKESTVIVPDEDEGKEDEIKLEENSQHILPYKCIREHLKNGDVMLI